MTRSDPRQTHRSPGKPVRSVPVAERKLNWSVVALATAGLGYNGLLALLAARGLPVSLAAQIVAEVLILSGAAVLILKTGFRQSDAPVLLFFLFFLATDLILSILNGAMIVDMARNAAIISLFGMLGTRCDERMIRRTFFIGFLIVTSCLVLELSSVQTYTAIFAPGAYFETTRGAVATELNELGLFPNALGFEGRFSILPFATHRTSSIFLEQVSLANFSTALIIFVTCLWDRISKSEKIAYLLLIALILVTNNSRTALVLVLAAPLIYVAAPSLGRFANLAIMPVMLLLATIITFTQPSSTEDTFVGRIGLTIKNLSAVDLSALLGAKATRAMDFLDSGYVYVLYGSTVIGLLTVWMFVSLISLDKVKAQARCGLYLSLYVFANLMVSGTSIFSMKVAGILWLLVGFLRGQTISDPVSQDLVKSDSRPATTTSVSSRLALGATHGWGSPNRR